MDMGKQTVYKRGNSGAPFVVVDPSHDIKVHNSKDYDQFVFTDENRPIYNAHLVNLKKSIAQNGYLTECPIHVIRRNGKLVITDGQHRFTACKDLGLEIFYLVKTGTEEEISRSIRVVNAYSRSWKDEDYLRHFLSLGFPDYRKLSDFMAAHDLSIGAAIGLLRGLHGDVGTGARQAFRVGDMKFGEDALLKASAAMLFVDEIRNVHERLAGLRRDPAFIKALLILTGSRQYEHDRFLRNLSANLVSCVWCTSVGRYLEMLESIYNYKRKDGTRIRLSRKGMTLISADDGDGG